MANKSQDLRELEKEMANVARLQKELASAMKLKMSEYGLPFDELGFATAVRGLGQTAPAGAVKSIGAAGAASVFKKRATHAPLSADTSALSPSKTIGVGSSNQTSRK